MSNLAKSCQLESGLPISNTELTAIEDGEDGEHVSWYVIHNQVWHAPVKQVGAADEGRHVVSLCQDEVGHDDLEHWKGEDDQGLNHDATPLLAGSQARCSHHRDLAGQIAHNLEYARGVERLHGEDGIHLQVAPAIARKPVLHIIVPPDEGIDNIEEVERHSREAEHGGGELAILPQQSHWHPAGDICQDTEEDSEE